MATVDEYIDPLLTGNSTPLIQPAGLSSALQGVVTQKLSLAPNDGGAVKKVLYAIWGKGTETDGSIYRVFRNLPGNIIPLSIRWAGAANAGLTSVSCGLYKSGNVVPGGPIGTPATAGIAAVVNGLTPANGAACFASAVNLAAGAVNFKEAVAFDLMKTINTAFSANPIVLGATLQTRLFEYAGETVLNRSAKYDLCLTLNTGGATPSTMGLIMEYISDA